MIFFYFLLSLAEEFLRELLNQITFFVAIETVYVQETLRFCASDRSHKSFESCPAKQNCSSITT